ncbi:MAG: Uma2 family endonuclease [Armatimonadota bacterium]|nr:Uma2 family endonuclease [Armatimonadota bacterium]
MVQMAQRAYSVGEYFVLEKMSDIKHEYYAGTIYAMAGASPTHNRIAGNIYVALHTALDGSSCEPFGSDLRVYTPSGLYTYPDVSVICGPLEFTDHPAVPSETVTNPVALFEVCSDATRDYDRGARFELYRAIPTLRYYVLVEQTAVSVELRSRGHDGEWTSENLTSLDDVLTLPSLNFHMTLRDIYARVEFASGL